MSADADVIEHDIDEERPGANLPAVVEHEALVARAEISVADAAAQRQKILELMDAVMTEGVHYGRVGGVKKPTLLKPGAEAIAVALRLAPDYESTKDYDGDHLTVTAKCRLSHITSGLFIAAGEGLCTTREAKYAYRQGERQCPDCGAQAIVRSTKKSAYFCIRDKGGCGHRFAFNSAEARELDSQDTARVPNPDLPDTWNTVLKMADKRALVAAILNGTAASDVFTQDVEDQPAAAADEERSGTAEEDETRSQTARRREGPEPFPVPKSWADIEAAVRMCDNKEEAWQLFCAFRRAASYHLFGVLVGDPDEDGPLLDAKQWARLGQAAACAAVWLNEHPTFEMGELFFFDEDKQRQAWAHCLDGTALEIPDYVPPEPPAPEPDPDLERQREAE